MNLSLGDYFISVDRMLVVVAYQQRSDASKHRSNYTSSKVTISTGMTASSGASDRGDISFAIFPIIWSTGSSSPSDNQASLSKNSSRSVMPKDHTSVAQVDFALRSMHSGAICAGNPPTFPNTVVVATTMDFTRLIPRSHNLVVLHPFLIINILCSRV